MSVKNKQNSSVTFLVRATFLIRPRSKILLNTTSIPILSGMLKECKIFGHGTDYKAGMKKDAIMFVKKDVSSWKQTSEDAGKFGTFEDYLGVIFWFWGLTNLCPVCVYGLLFIMLIYSSIAFNCVQILNTANQPNSEWQWRKSICHQFVIIG